MAGDAVRRITDELLTLPLGEADPIPPEDLAKLYQQLGELGILQPVGTVPAAEVDELAQQADELDFDTITRYLIQVTQPTVEMATIVDTSTDNVEDTEPVRYPVRSKSDIVDIAEPPSAADIVIEVEDSTLLPESSRGLTQRQRTLIALSIAASLTAAAATVPGATHETNNPNATTTTTGHGARPATANKPPVTAQGTAEITPAQRIAFQKEFISKIAGLNTAERNNLFASVQVLEELMPLFKQMHVDPVVVLAQWWDESRLGTATPHDNVTIPENNPYGLPAHTATGAPSRNPFGMKQWGNGPYVLCWTHEVVKQNGQWVTVRVPAKFTVFSGPKEAFTALANLFQIKRYQNTHQYADKDQDNKVAELIHEDGYATARDYAKTLIHIMTKNRLRDLLYPERTLSSQHACETIDGNARMLCIAELYDGIYYKWGGGHDAGDTKYAFAKFMEMCNAHDLMFASVASTARHQGPCSRDCSGLVSDSADEFERQRLAELGVTPQRYYDWVVDGILHRWEAGSEYWQPISFKDAQPGDIVIHTDMVNGKRVGGHTAFYVGTNSDGTVRTYEASQTGEPNDFHKRTRDFWDAGVFRWVGPGSKVYDDAHYGTH
ncbi:MAG TPA: glucosaminidase domain-containing protein [Patescibacteria group bacterium]|nr:glucosaminidase domain-containing protein [Patescibacteria group bacterium]